MLHLNESERDAAAKFKTLCETFNSKLKNPHKVLVYQYIVSEETGVGQQCIFECVTLGVSEDITDYASW